MTTRAAVELSSDRVSQTKPRPVKGFALDTLAAIWQVFHSHILPVKALVVAA
jgi:hypothetical protein